MTVDEYKKKFIDLFKQLSDEQGKIKEIEMYREEIRALGSIIEEKIICKIVFE